MSHKPGLVTRLTRHLTAGTPTLALSDAQGRPARNRENLMADARPFPGKGYRPVNPRAGQLSHSPIVIIQKESNQNSAAPQSPSPTVRQHTHLKKAR